MQVIETDPTASLFVVRLDGQACEIDLLRVGVGPPALLDIGPVVNRDDAQLGAGAAIAAMTRRGRRGCGRGEAPHPGPECGASLVRAGQLVRS